jgi:DNA-binding GntR family transcriptional regulator
VTRYLDIRHILAGEIASGRYAIGGRFPTDKELCARFGASRHSVREALRQLQDQGLLARRRGAGTVLRGQVPQIMFVRDAAEAEGAADHAGGDRFERLSERRLVMGEALAAVLGCAAGTRWLCIAGMRCGADSIPSWTEIYVAEPYFGIRGEAVAGEAAVSDLIRRRHGVEITAIEHDVGLHPIDAGRAGPLGVAPETPGLLVVRRYYGTGREPFEIAASLCPAERARYRARLTRSGDAAGASAPPAGP